MLGFQFRQPFGLVDLHTALLLPPAILGLIGDTELFKGLRCRCTLGKQHIGFAELVNDLFGVVSFLWHGSDLLNWLLTTLDLDREIRDKLAPRVEDWAHWCRGDGY